MRPVGPTRPDAFTLLELLVVIGLVAVFAFVLAGAVGGGGKTAALSTAQINLANLIVTARARAAATARPVRLVLHSDGSAPERYLRYLVLQEQGGAPGAWTSRQEYLLPAGIYVLPQQTKMIPGALPDDVRWKKSDNVTVLHSSVFSDPLFAAQINSDHPETWDALVYNARGVPANSGVIVLATGLVRPPGSFAPTDSPVRFSNPDNVRGISVSSYGMPTLLNGRDAF